MTDVRDATAAPAPRETPRELSGPELATAAGGKGVIRVSRFKETVEPTG